jgi:hypothetical protein
VEFDWNRSIDKIQEGSANRLFAAANIKLEVMRCAVGDDEPVMSRKMMPTMTRRKFERIQIRILFFIGIIIIHYNFLSTKITTKISIIVVAANIKGGYISHRAHLYL